MAKGRKTGGRKPAAESRAAELRARLLEWKQTPEPQRPSLRALARELGTSHQLLSFYAGRLGPWLSKGYRREAGEIRTRAEAESRSMTAWEEAQVRTLEREAFFYALEPALTKAIRQMGARARRGEAFKYEIRALERIARRGNPEAQKALACIARRNLPGAATSVSKSFRRDRA